MEVTQETVPTSRGRAPFLRLRSIVVVLATVIAATLTIASPAHATVTKSFAVYGPNETSVAGELEWYNNAVDVTVSTFPTFFSDSTCVAAVFNGYHKNGTRLAREVIGYDCGGSYYHFKLQASNATGPIQTVEIVLWISINLKTPFESNDKKYYRP